MGYMGRHTWNFFHVLCNVLYFAHVNLMGDFLQNSPSMIYSSMHNSSIDILIYGGFPLSYDLVVYGRVLIPGQGGVVSYVLGTTTLGRIILSAHPH